MLRKLTVSPALPGGFRDYLPEEMIPRQRMLDAIRTVFERFGFVPLDTPGVEREEILTGGDPDFRMNIFRLARGKESDASDAAASVAPGVSLPAAAFRSELALRFDLTVPLARVVSLYPDRIEKPFKRYQIGKVWRGEKPQAGRFCEFAQCDADIVGSDRMSADAEIVSLIYETLTGLGVEEFEIKVNNRKILNGLAAYVGFPPDRTTDVLRLIDKLDKFDWDVLAAELTDSIGLDGGRIDRLKAFLDLRAGGPEETCDAVLDLMKDSSEAVEGAKELAEIATYADALGVPREAWRIDLSVARGLGYYTGPVFETFLRRLPKIGSVFSGGRYDGLVARFGGDAVPATGASVGIDRLFVALETLGRIAKSQTTVKAVVLNFDAEAEAYCHRVVAALRRADIPAELYLGREKTLKGQLAYALRREVPIILIAGTTERDRGVVQVKDPVRRTQKEVPLSELPEAARAIVG